LATLTQPVWVELLLEEETLDDELLLEDETLDEDELAVPSYDVQVMSSTATCPADVEDWINWMVTLPVRLTV